MFKPSQRLRNLYNRLNTKYFDGELTGDVLVGWNDEIPDDECGQTVAVEEDGHKFFRITIDPKFSSYGHIVEHILLHEMSHVKLYPWMKHGKTKWKEEVIRVFVRGGWELW